MRPGIGIAFLLSILLSSLGFGQTNQLLITAEADPVGHYIDVEQEIIYYNSSEQTLNEIYLLDWANSFSTKTSELGVRFAENFNNRFYFEQDKNRGRTQLNSLTDAMGSTLEYSRPKVDLIQIALPEGLAPGASKSLKLNYRIILPNDRFTRFGYDNDNNLKLRYWYMAPAVFKDGWKAYSNKNLNDFYTDPFHVKVSFTAPTNYKVISNLNTISARNTADVTTTVLTGDNRTEIPLYVTKNFDFESVITDEFEVVTNLDDNKISPPLKALNIDRIIQFLKKELGPYPLEKMIISREDYKMSPVYGLNQLPDFISPFPDGFQYDIEQLKTITAKYLKNTLMLDPRKDHWLYGGIQVYLMMKYTDLYYPDMKIIGSLSNLWVIKWSHASDLEFNDQYELLYMNMVRNNLDQSLTTAKDSLVKFNKNIASSYKAGVGFKFLKNYLDSDALDESIRNFYQQNVLKPTSSKAFADLVKQKAELPVDWFFDEYVETNVPIDFKIKRVKRMGDSLRVTIKNKTGVKVPVPLYGLHKDSIVYTRWLAPVDSLTTVTIPREGIRQLALNYNRVVPEINNRNNYKNLKGIFNKPIEFRLFLDVEDPKYNQSFVMPIFDFNVYDGLSIGPKLYNKTVLPKNWNYRIQPRYALKSNQIVGSASVVYTDYIQNRSLYAMRYGFSGGTSSYNVGLNFRRYTPFITFSFRDPDNLRSNMRQTISLRNINIDRDEDPNVPLETPNYSVFNLQYTYSDNNLIDFYKGTFSYELSDQFSKVTTTLEYRKLFLSNRQLNLRFFAGVFLFNDTPRDDDFFSFALDRPTDYLFDYDYYGRSDDSGIFSQQIIIAEGGFKSQLEPAFSNSWIATVNASTNIWKWIFAYGDAGLIHNRDRGTQAVFDSGIRLSLVADYFEVFLPLYSSLGWEPSLGNYDQRIRFIVTLSPQTLFRLFTREWY
ncbi:metalloprotease [Gilvibacter sp.]|uniref:metalloprotease n=1 Tax=Gilvibacter sp. TaxID=2729997 RepID=UPI0025C6E916|nr:metalloprotease [Gilvibacter sp.]NQX76911.1 metalloprotease [Gilvibacter sp.]